MIQLCHSFKSELNFWSCGYILWMNQIVAFAGKPLKEQFVFFLKKDTRPWRQEHWTQCTLWTTLRLAEPTDMEPRDKEGRPYYIIVSTWGHWASVDLGVPGDQELHCAFKSLLPLPPVTLSYHHPTLFKTPCWLLSVQLSHQALTGRLGHWVISSWAQDTSKRFNPNDNLPRYCQTF